MNIKRSVVRVGIAAVLAVASGMSFCDGVRFDADTLAFYPFDGGMAGDYLQAQNNAVDALVLPGQAMKNTSCASSTVRMSDETPGKYIFAGRPVASNVVYENPKSLRLGSGTLNKDASDNTYGYFYIPGAGRELSRHHATGFTLEFFFKLNPEDDVYYYSYFVRFDAGFTINSVAGPINTSFFSETKLRTAVNSTTASGANNKTICDATDLSSVIPGFVTIKDGRWHHFAVVEGANSDKISIYLDKVLLGEKTLASLGLTATTLETSADVVIGRGVNTTEYAFGGAISCVKLTKKALVADEFLTASDGVRQDDDLLLVYPFTDKSSGESAVGSGTIRNSVRPDLNLGTVILSTDASAVNPSVKFDGEDIPAPVIYAGKRSLEKQPIYENPQSLCFDSESTGRSGSIRFYSVGNLISTLHGVGYTFEYFVKYLDDDIQSYNSFLSYNCGYGPAAGGNRDMRVYLPMSSSAEFCRNLVYSIGTQDSATPGAQRSGPTIDPDILHDGKWHHVAIVAQPKTEEDHVEISVYVDGKKYGRITSTTADVVTAVCNLTMCNASAFHVKIACVTLRKGVVASENFLRGYNAKAGGIIMIVR